MTTKDAIKHLSYKISYCKGVDRMWVDGVNVDALEIAVRAMAEERKKGKWICYGFTLHKCSLCGFEDAFIEPNNFCANCGADMREEKTDETN